MHNPFGFAGRARGVKDEQRVFSVHAFGFTLAVGGCGGFVIPHVAATAPCHIATGTLYHNNGIDPGAFIEGFVHVCFQWNVLTTAHALIRGNDQLTIGVVNAALQGFGREAAEYHRVNSADTGAGEHRVRSFGNHGKVNAHPIALFYTSGAHDIG